MSDNTLPVHIETLLTGLQDDPSLAQGVTDAVGQLTGTQRAEAAATYFRSAGFEVTADELIALEIARKQATGESLSEHELETVAGGAMWVKDIPEDPFRWSRRFPWQNYR